jgi:hypothetical protein
MSYIEVSVQICANWVGGSEKVEQKVDEAQFPEAIRNGHLLFGASEFIDLQVTGADEFNVNYSMTTMRMRTMSSVMMEVSTRNLLSNNSSSSRFEKMKMAKSRVPMTLLK